MIIDVAHCVVSAAAGAGVPALHVGARQVGRTVLADGTLGPAVRGNSLVLRHADTRWRSVGVPTNGIVSTWVRHAWIHIADRIVLYWC